MSIEAITAALYCSQAKAAAKLVLVAIADGISHGTDYWYAYVDDIADVAGYGHRFTTTQITKLVNAGELVVETVGGKRCNYYIPLLPGEEGYEPEECKEQHSCNGWHTPLSTGRTITARKNRKARQAAAKQKRRPPRNDSSQQSQEREFLGTIAPANEQDLGTIAPSARNDSSQDLGTIVPSGRNDSSQHVLIEDTGLYTGTIPGGFPGVRMRAREALPSTDEKTNGALALQRDPPPLPPPPAPAPEHAREKKALWRDITYLLPNYGVTKAQVEPMRSAHLYEPLPGVYKLQVPRGQTPDSFKVRYEVPIRQALAALLKQGNQLLEFAS